ncbi:UreD-domain-containing protein [Rhodocollybia butyracea]|uniref:UreD-domain-containing protein n=1 Tax=Rhodocollybia butyracea TaxID=206335 RepID=A0A9P5Q0P7_9AGAR|nr:UreD-domain-containing protein [Rhodocollybia butyracea]
MTTSSSIAKIPSGGGRIALSTHGGKAWFSELSATYPLKLLSPRISDDVAIVYALTYGGGLVAGDCIHLSVKVECGAKLVLLSQGSTKVFKTRLQQRLSSVQRSLDDTPMGTPSQSQITLQKMDFTISSNGALFLLPDPVTCFRSASYNQIQTFHIAKDTSLVLLDWVTSGRKSLGETWVFSRYYSVNEVVVEGKRIAKDVMLLEDDASESSLSRRLAEKLDPFSCYATLILRGSLVEKTIASLTARYQNISVMQQRIVEDILWSISPIGSDNDGVVIRVAGKETEDVKCWLSEALSPLEDIVGVDVYRMAFHLSYRLCMRANSEN